MCTYTSWQWSILQWGVNMVLKRVRVFELTDYGSMCLIQPINRELLGIKERAQFYPGDQDGRFHSKYMHLLGTRAWMLYLWRGYGSNVSHWYATLLNAVLDRFQNEDNLTRMHLTLPMLRLLSSNAQVCKPCHVGIHWIVLTEYFHMSVHVPGFQSFWGFFCIILHW